MIDTNKFLNTKPYIYLSLEQNLEINIKQKVKLIYN